MAGAAPVSRTSAAGSRYVGPWSEPPLELQDFTAWHGKTPEKNLCVTAREGKAGPTLQGFASPRRMILISWSLPKNEGQFLGLVRTAIAQLNVLALKAFDRAQRGHARASG